ncbi:MAG: MarR family transcriptional regulator [bacterium]
MIIVVIATIIFFYINKASKMTKNNKCELNFEESIAYVINRTAIKLKTYLFKQFKDSGFDITPEQLAVLIGLSQKNGQYQKELGDKILKDKPNMTRLLDILEKRGLITRKSDKTDRRKFKIFITKEGETTLELLLPITVEARNKAIKDIKDEEIEQVIKILNKITLNIENV